TLSIYTLSLHDALPIFSRSAQGSGALPPGVWLAYLLLMISAVVMLVMWIGALIRLGQQHAWGWFVGVLVSHLVGLGIIGMVAYRSEEHTSELQSPCNLV